MSVLDEGAQTVSSVAAVGKAVSNLANALFGGSASQDAYWYTALQPASFRGVDFSVLAANSEFGRRTAIHEYPYRDTVWAEDMGRSARRFNLRGFIVGDDVISRRERLIAKSEETGDGKLIHPTYGELTVSLLRPLAITERWDQGRYFELSFSFIESGQRVFPAVIHATEEDVEAYCDAADAAASGDFTDRAGAALKEGAEVVGQAVDTVAGYARQAQRLGNDATNLYHMATTLQGSFGRFFGGRNKGGFVQALQGVQGGAQDIRSLIGIGATARNNISRAASSLSAIAADLGP